MFPDLTGVSSNFKDKRVDRILAKEGIIDAEVYYSPIQIWLFMIFLITLSSLVLWGGILHLLWKFPILTISYFLVAYLFTAYHNNSFALTSDKLIIVNPNFPFRNFYTYDIKSIHQIMIDKSRYLSLLSILSINFSDANFIEVYTNEQVKRFYCINLNVDAYDENWTEKTMDDFHSGLISLKIKVLFNLW